MRGTSVCQFLAHELGHATAIADLERRFAAYEITNAEFAEVDAGAYAGRTLQWAAQALDEIPCIAGIGPTVAELTRRGIPALITTISWRFAAQVIAERHGFAGVCGTEMLEQPPGVLSGRVASICDEYGKRRFVEEYCARHAIPLNRVFAVGDARSDIPLFGAVGFSIAINATAEARAAATVALDTDTLTDVLELIDQT